MYEYKFIEITLKTRLTGTKPVEDYHEIIDHHAKEGWKLVQIFAPAIKGYGAAEYYEIILERQK